MNDLFQNIEYSVFDVQQFCRETLEMVTGYLSTWAKSLSNLH